MSVSCRCLMAALILACSLAPMSASAIIRRHDVPDSQYIVQASDYPAIVDLLINAPGDCIATLIAPEWLITAAHCTDSLMLSNDIRVGSNIYNVAEIHTHSGWRDNTDDITIIRLDSAVADVTPIPVYTGSDEVGHMVLFVGRGDTSTGDVGGGTADGNTRAATNTVVGADAFWLSFVFNAPGDAAVTALEGISGDGDSGGPALLETPEGLRVAGLSSYQEEGGQTLGTYGVEEFYTRVSQYTDWIDERVGPTAPLDAGTPVDTGPKPRPDAAVMDAPTPDAISMDAIVVDQGVKPVEPTPAAMDGGALPEQPRRGAMSGGCGCRTEPPSAPDSLSWVVVFGVFVVARRRRRKRNSYCPR